VEALDDRLLPSGGLMLARPQAAWGDLRVTRFLPPQLPPPPNLVGQCITVYDDAGSNFHARICITARDADGTLHGTYENLDRYDLGPVQFTSGFEDVFGRVSIFVNAYGTRVGDHFADHQMVSFTGRVSPTGSGPLLQGSLYEYDVLNDPGYGLRENDNTYQVSSGYYI
jgi:hypothetical protein